MTGAAAVGFTRAPSSGAKELTKDERNPPLNDCIESTLCLTLTVSGEKLIPIRYARGIATVVIEAICRRSFQSNT